MTFKTHYEPVPVTEKPEESGTYMTKWTGVPAFTEKEFKDGEWQTRFGNTGLMTHWLRPRPDTVLLTREEVEAKKDEIKAGIVAGVETFLLGDWEDDGKLNMKLLYDSIFNMIDPKPTSITNSNKEV